ncbi:uncharacterized protein JN550_013821 [Neoarthrinium moseri]|uniref:uncharacterized protein n=1 Tax=Neoarthrinium moseri TaxID=1658444 RepID=UPI001FDAED58|nr:uncharacterized protein JN550_013821 [Neoarthrinium moseri]KAI1856347.1 hypothetical protein JN550_013821 [Neoarthrinium moseri]
MAYSHRLGSAASRGFSATAVNRYQYDYRKALAIAGPLLKKSDKRSHLNTNKGTVTSKQPLPLALDLKPPVLDPLQRSLAEILDHFGSTKLGEQVTAVDPVNQPEISNEASLIEEAGPYFFQVAKHLLPDLLRSLGYDKPLEICTEPQSSKSSVPDKVIKYDHKPILVLDYKGPNCIFEDELELCSAETEEIARERLQETELDRARTDLENPTDSLLFSPGVTKDTVRLIQQGVKYFRATKAPMILFYDYDILLALEVPSTLLDGASDVLIGTTVWKEPQKSTEDEPVPYANNHVAVLLRMVIRAIEISTN